jgi:hypothetical protein
MQEEGEEEVADPELLETDYQEMNEKGEFVEES